MHYCSTLSVYNDHYHNVLVKYLCFMHFQFFKIDVYGKGGKPLSVRQLVQHLRNVVERSTHPTHPIGILTTQNRNVWGKAYKQLRKGNASVSTPFFLS